MQWHNHTIVHRKFTFEGAEYRLRKKSFFAGASGEVCLPHNPFPWEKPNAFSLFGANGPFTGAKPPVCRKDFSPNQGPAAAELSARFARSTRKEGDKSPPFHTFSPMYPITPSLGKTQHIFSFRGQRPYKRGKAPIKRNLCLFLSLFLWGGSQRMAANRFWMRPRAENMVQSAPVCGKL